ncbi:hypothetical protein N7481_012898 [Penicillium waksmanii]|uniref:uncharacterized protein n=1 Tax=Penicillium waksmanii TaxID=69791 RepID=UPI002547AE7A|nr:uncharacterized protein N7481_012898 [Penicillium waksmanii]KAJ5966184.1 hypothetical protein N7481_012898 [Penicillium waksmanii]
MISKQLPNITAFHENLDFTATLANLSIYAGETSDVVDSAAMLAFMMSSSVSSMAQVEDVGEDYEEQKIINIILWFATGILFLIPCLEGGAEALELADVAPTLRLNGTAGDVGIASRRMVHLLYSAYF